MPTPFRTHSAHSRAERGFSLVELLTVIAIIAILAAIIFPVFATVRENARQSTSLSNLHDISTKLGQYQLDHHAYPPVLFGYAYPNPTNPVAMDKALEAAQTAGVADQYFPGLYPEYINNINEFTDPNNDVGYDKTWVPDTNSLCTGATNSDDSACGSDTPGTLVKSSVPRTTGNGTSIPYGFYKADAYDASPLVTGPNSTDKTAPVTRYEPSWTSITNTGDTTAAPLNNWHTSAFPPQMTQIQKDDLYLRQLRWRSPPPDAYVTCTTYHVPTSNQVMVLFAGGNAKKFDYTQFVSHGVDSSTINVVNGASTATFWEVTPNGK